MTISYLFVITAGRDTTRVYVPTSTSTMTSLLSDRPHHTCAAVTNVPVANARRVRPKAVQRLLALMLLAASLVSTGVVATAESVRADGLVAQPLPTNALAADVTAAATTAVDLYDSFVVTGDRSTYREFVTARSGTARLAARQLGYPELDMALAWSRTPLEHQRAVLAAMTQVGVPYRRNTSEEGVGFDCSGLTTFAWREAGVELLRQSGSQINNALRLDRASAKAGDLVQYPGHVMMYLGIGDAIIHSVQSGRTVEIDVISAKRTDSVRFGDPTG